MASASIINIIFPFLQGVVELTPDTVLVSKQPFIASFTYHLRNYTRNTYVGDIIGNINVSQFGVLLVNREVFCLI